MGHLIISANVCLKSLQTVSFSFDSSSISGMLSHEYETQQQATVKVLSRLGDDNLSMLKFNLKTGYAIDLDHDDDNDDSTYTLEELQIALQRILGSYGARLLICEIQNEIRLLVAK